MKLTCFLCLPRFILKFVTLCLKNNENNWNYQREREREGEIRGRERKTNKQKENKFNSKKQFGNNPFIN